MREHRRKEHGPQRGSRAQSVDVAQPMGDVDDKSLKEELEMFKQSLVVTEMEDERHRVYNFVMDTLDPKYLMEKINVLFHSLKRVAKLKEPFDFVLKNVEDGSYG